MMLTVIALLGFGVDQANAQISMTTTGSDTQAFNTLAT